MKLKFVPTNIVAPGIEIMKIILTPWGKHSVHYYFQFTVLDIISYLRNLISNM